MDKRIWCFWEPASAMPGYLRACLRTIELSAGAPVHLLTAREVAELAPDMKPWLVSYIPSVAQRTDYYRSHLLLAQGGVWLDIDVVVLDDLTFLFDMAEQHDLVARVLPGHVSVSLLASRPGSPAIAEWIGRQEEILTSGDSNRLEWSALGSSSLTPAAASRDVHAVPTTRVAPIPWRQSDLFLSRHLGPSSILQNRPATVLLYNARFPPWLRTASEREILDSPIMLSRLLRIALGESAAEDEERATDRFLRPLERGASLLTMTASRLRRGADVVIGRRKGASQHVT